MSTPTPTSAPSARATLVAARDAHDLWTIEEVADFLRCAVVTVRRYVRANAIPAYRLAGQRTLLFRREDIEALLLEPENDSARDRN